MRRLLACLLLIFCVLGCRAAPAGDNPPSSATLDSLTKWVGQYPSDKIEGRSVWDNEPLKNMVGEVLDDYTVGVLYNELATGVSTPVERKGNWLSIFVCRSHACSLNSASLFVNPDKKILAICWRNVYDEHDAWLITGSAPVIKPVGFCTENRGFDLLEKNVK